MARDKKKSESLFQFMNHLIALLQKNGQHRTMLHYKATLNSFKRFRGDKEVTLQEIDAELIQSYEAYLKNISKVCSNTSSFYLRTLRAVYNKAVEKGMVLQEPSLTDDLFVKKDFINLLLPPRMGKRTKYRQHPSSYQQRLGCPQEDPPPLMLGNHPEKSILRYIAKYLKIHGQVS